MPRLTITITEEQGELLEQLSGDGGEYESKSAAVREFIRRGEELREMENEIARLEERIEAREQRIDELERQLAERSELEEKIEDLPAKLDAEVVEPPFVVRWWQWWRERD